MTQYKLIVAAPALQTLAACQLPIPVAYKLFNLIKKVSQYQDFYGEQQQKIIKECNGNIDQEVGLVTFGDPADKEKYLKMYEELISLEADDEVIEIDMDDMEGQKICAADLVKLDGIIDFKE